MQEIKSTDDFRSVLKDRDTKSNIDFISTWLSDNLSSVAKGNYTGYGTRCAYNTDYGCTSFSATCHRQFSSEACGNTTFVSTLFTNNMWPEVNRVYLEYILGPESPWRDILDDDFVLIRDDKDGYPYGFIFFNVADKDIKLLTSFLIISRHSGSWNQSHFFDFYLRSGFTKPEAIFLSSFHYMDFNATRENYSPCFVKQPNSLTSGKVVIYSGGPNYGDQAFNPKCDVNRLAKSKPDMKGNSGSLKSGVRPNPCNKIWDHGLGNFLSSSNEYSGLPPDQKIYAKVVTGTMKQGGVLSDDIVKKMRQGIYGEKMIYFGDY